MNTQAYETFVSSYKSRQKTRLLASAGAMLLGFLLAATGIGIIVALVAMVFFVVYAVRGSVLKSHAKKSLKVLHKAGQYEHAMEAIQQVSSCQIDEQTYAWNDEYFYLPYGAVYPLKKMAWIHLFSQTVSYMFIIRFTANACKLFLNDGTETLLFYGKAKDQEAFKKLLIALKEKNPDLLLGYNAENQQLYNQIKAANK